MSFNINNFVNNFINKINGNKTNSNNNSNTNNINNSTLFNYKETPDVEPEIKMAGIIRIPDTTPEPKKPNFPIGTTGIVVAPTPTPTVEIMPDRPMTGIVVAPTPTPTVEIMPDRPMTGIVAAPTPTPTVEIMPDRPMTGIVAAPPQDTTPTTPQKPKLPSIFGKIFGGNSIFSKINNIFTSIFRRF